MKKYTGGGILVVELRGMQADSLRLAETELQRAKITL